MKAKAVKFISFAIKDYLLDLMIEHQDSMDTWRTLKDKYKNGILAMVINPNYKLLTFESQKFTSMEEFLIMACEIKKQLAILGQTALAKTFVQIIFNQLHPTFNTPIYNLKDIDQFLSFEKILCRLIVEAHIFQFRENINENLKSEALVVQTSRTNYNSKNITNRENYLCCKDRHTFSRLDKRFVVSYINKYYAVQKISQQKVDMHILQNLKDMR